MKLATYYVSFELRRSQPVDDALFDQGCDCLDDNDIEDRLREAIKPIMDDPRMAPFKLVVSN